MLRPAHGLQGLLLPQVRGAAARARRGRAAYKVLFVQEESGMTRTDKIELAKAVLEEHKRFIHSECAEGLEREEDYDK